MCRRFVGCVRSLMKIVSTTRSLDAVSYVGKASVLLSAEVMVSFAHSREAERPGNGTLAAHCRRCRSACASSLTLRVQVLKSIYLPKTTITVGRIPSTKLMGT